MDWDELEALFSVLEEPSLRDRAEDAWVAEEMKRRIQEEENKRAVLIACHETIHEILGETNGLDPVVALTSNGGTVELTIDNIRFRVSVSRRVDGDGDVVEERKLAMRSAPTTWAVVASLAEVGRTLQAQPCWVTPPTDVPRHVLAPEMVPEGRSCNCQFKSECNGACTPVNYGLAGRRL